MLERVRNHLLSGLLALAPLFFTVLVIRYLLKLTDAFVVNPVFHLLPIQLDAAFKIVLAKIAIGLCVLVFIALVGIATEKIFARQFLRGAEALFKGIPLFNKLYGSFQDLVQAFFGDKKGVFKRVVFVEYPRKGIYALGFVMQERRWDIHEKTGRRIINVFIPSPPNPATGLFIFVPKEEIIESDLTVEDGIKLVISGGAVVPPLRP